MVRKAKAEDIPAILSLLVQVNMVHHNGRPDLFHGPATKYTAEELSALLLDERTPVFVYEDGGEVLGHAFCVLQEHPEDHILTDIKTLYIDDICVDEKARGRKIGQALYEYAEDFARGCGCHNVTLNVWECNPGARRFYEAMGMAVQKTGMEKVL